MRGWVGRITVEGSGRASPDAPDPVQVVDCLLPSIFALQKGAGLSSPFSPIRNNLMSLDVFTSRVHLVSLQDLGLQSSLGLQWSTRWKVTVNILWPRTVVARDLGPTILGDCLPQAPP